MGSHTSHRVVIRASILEKTLHNFFNKSTNESTNTLIFLVKKFLSFVAIVKKFLGNWQRSWSAEDSGIELD